MPFYNQPRTIEQLPTAAPNQIAAQDQALQLALQGLQGLGQNSTQGSKFDFAPIAEQARRNFQTRTAPSISERFNALGVGPSSSAVQSSLAGAGANLERDLAALQQQYNFNQQGYDLQRQGQQSQLLQNLLGIGLQPNFQNLIQPEQPGFLTGASAGLGQGLGASLPYLLGSLGSGAATGTTLGGPIGGLLGGGLNTILALLKYLGQGR